MVLPFLTLYLTGKELHRTLSEAGFVMAMFGLGSVIGAYFGGKFSDKIGFYKVQLITLFGGAIMFIILGQLKSYPLICICTFFLSMINEAFRPANSSAIAFYSTPENRTRSYSLNRLSINLGWAVGVSIGGLIAAYDYELLFWVDGFTNLLAVLLLFYFLKPKVQPKKEEIIKEDVPEVMSAYKDKTYLRFLFLMVLFSSCFAQLFTTIPKYFRDDLLLNEKYIGMIMAVNGIIIVAIEMVLVYILEKRNRTTRYIVIGLVFCSFSYLSLLIPGNAKFISLLMILFISMGEIMAMPFMNTFWIKRTNDRNRGQYAALYTISWGIGNTLGPFLCSALIDHTSFQVGFIALAFVLFCSAFGFYKLKS